MTTDKKKKKKQDIVQSELACKSQASLPLLVKGPPFQGKCSTPTVTFPLILYTVFIIFPCFYCTFVNILQN